LRYGLRFVTAIRLDFNDVRIVSCRLDDGLWAA